MASRKNLRSAGVAGLIALALVVSGCSSSSDPDTWVEADETGKIEENFIRACTEGDDGNSDPADLADYATKQLRKRGVDVMTGVGTKAATATAVELADGSLIPTRTIVATIGNLVSQTNPATYRLRERLQAIVRSLVRNCLTSFRHLALRLYSTF